MPKQIDAIHGMYNKPVGVLYMPTGGGKTVIIYGHAKMFFGTAIKHNFIISGPIMDLNKQTACSVLTNLFNDGLINSENCDVVIANCANYRSNRFYTVKNGENIDIVNDIAGHEPLGILVNTIDVKQEKQYRITVVCNPTLQNDEKFLDKLTEDDVVKHFYFDESQTLKKDQTVNTEEDNQNNKNWVNFKKIFTIINMTSVKGSCHMVSATPTKDNFETIMENNFGMSYEDCFAYRLTPREAINARMILEPQFYFKRCSKLKVDTILVRIEDIINDINKEKEKNTSYKARILVTVASTADLNWIVKRLLEKYGSDYDVYSTSCMDKKKKNNETISEDICAFKKAIEENERSCFVVHIKQIIAGIDIPSFTHTVFNMEATTNFITPIQIVGRVLRPERFPDGTANLTKKKFGYIYVNIENNNILAEKAARTLIGYYGNIFEFLKPDFFEGYTNGSNVRHKQMSQFGDNITAYNFTNTIENFLKDLAVNIKVDEQEDKYLGINIDYNNQYIKTQIETIIKRDGYVENLPVFFIPELTEYINKVSNYMATIDKFINIFKSTDANQWRAAID
ncbi:MAG: hypothetical protein IJH65_13055 [Methanobrevibacter sp.]|nr:hypothetical protein [Methanobrevibacter sp.]